MRHIFTISALNYVLLLISMEEQTPSEQEISEMR